MQYTCNVMLSRVRVASVAVVNRYVAVAIQHVKRMCCVILSSVACSAVLYFSTLFHKRHDFRKKKIWTHKMYGLILSITSTRNIFHSKKNSVRYYKCENVLM